MQAERVTDTITYHGEGPVWWTRWGKLRLVDMLAGDVLTLEDDGSVVRTPVGSPVAAVLRPRLGGGAIVAREHDIAISDYDDLRELRSVAQVTDDPLVRCNEGGCDPQGRFYIGTMAYSQVAGAGTLYGWDSQHLWDVASLITISNGLAWSPDGSTAFYNDSGAQTTYTFTQDPDRGLINRHVLIRHEEGHPDGLCIDSEGGIWTAMYGLGQVRRFDPDGTLTEIIDVEPQRTTACCFGGTDLGTLYITTSRENLPPDEEPAAGSVYAVRPGVTGQDPLSFAD